MQCCHDFYNGNGWDIKNIANEFGDEVNRWYNGSKRIESAGTIAWEDVVWEYGKFNTKKCEYMIVSWKLGRQLFA